MKTFAIISIIFICVLSIVFAIFHFSNRYQSAFEADQNCHSEIYINYSEDSKVGCDHDLETRQWILYKEGINGLPANVLERYKY